MKKLLLYALVVLTAIFIAGCDNPRKSNSLKKVLDAGVLKVGTQYGVTSYYNSASGPQGYEYEMAKGFADYLGVELEILPYYAVNELFPQLDNQHIDIIASALTITPERQELFRFGPAYQYVSQKLVFKQGRERPRDISQIDGELLVTSDSNHAATLEQLSEAYPQLSWMETDDMDEEEMLEQVLAGELDYTITDSSFLAVMRRRHPDLSIGFTIGEQQPVAWALNNDLDDSLLAALIEYFGKIQSNGQLATLEDKYFGHVREFNYVDTRLFIKAADDTLPKFQPWFEAYSGDIDWRLLAAMAYQESHWNPRAKSPTGVRGMMMLTLTTAKELGVRSRLDAEQSIRGGSQYFASLMKRIPDRITHPDRIWFSLAAYNLGLGHVEDARVITQRQGGNPDLWVDVKKRLPLLRQKRHYKNTRYGYARGNEAVTYVENIRRYYDTLVWLDDRKRSEQSLALSETN
ncbi:membrane-bound lytic murein transglycosylase MltF [Alteromonadaceae bacterium M269]|nr:membrane-bound lytic murein transglycosylase MltF [Alteromonadaceae bacterium M269]